MLDRTMRQGKLSMVHPGCVGNTGRLELRFQDVANLITEDRNILRGYILNNAMADSPIPMRHPITHPDHARPVYSGVPSFEFC